MINEENHIAIYVSGSSNKEKIIHEMTDGALLKQWIDTTNLTGELYSDLAVSYFVEEELTHEHFEVAEAGRGLGTMSDGEKKKKLLTYIISKKPDYVIIDSVFDHLDIASQSHIASRLKELSKTTIIIQLTGRIDDILPFINKIFVTENNQFIQITPEELFKKVSSVNNEIFSNPVPPPLYEQVMIKDPLIKFSNVHVNYDDRPILNNINWEINCGQFWQLIGPNGSGKSTILSMIIGDNPKAYGQDIILFGNKKGSGESVWEIKEKIGYFNSSMIHHFARLHSIEHMIISGFFDTIGLYTKPSDMQIKLANEWLNLIGLSNQKDKHFLNLSIGHQRLILIARAMVKHPPLLILDEPTAGLDDHDVAIFSALVNKIAAESNTAIIYVSHRKEIGLSPQFIFELTPALNGSEGKILN